MQHETRGKKERSQHQGQTLQKERVGDTLNFQTLTPLPHHYANRSRPLSANTWTLSPPSFPQPDVHNSPTPQTTTTYTLIPKPLHLVAPSPNPHPIRNHGAEPLGRFVGKCSQLRQSTPLRLTLSYEPEKLGVKS